MTAVIRGPDARVVGTAAVIVAISAMGVHRMQPRLASEVHNVKAIDDVYPFPPPAEFRVATLGYIAATTDYLWGKLLVEHGSHWAEHRAFPDLTRYLDALIGLDPTFPPFYEFVDTLLCFRPPTSGTAEDARAARAYLERGTKELPYSADVWLHYGQFIGFLAPSFLTDDAERQAWRHDGAVALNHAVELGADVERAIAASDMLGNRFGEREAQIRGLEHAYVLADDEAYRLSISAQLERLQANQMGDLARETVQAVEGRWRRDAPYVDRGTYLLIGPVTDPLRCTGRRASGARECAHDWDAALAH
jgi:hypothetical protein